MLLLFLALGACAGSFVGVLVDRLPRGLDPWRGRSRCDACGVALGARDLVPLVSVLWLRGRCRRCGAPIRRFLIVIELAGAAIGGTAAALAPHAALAAAGLGWGLLALAVIDARHFLLPDAITLPLLVAGLIATGWLAPTALTGHALGAVAGYLGLCALDAAYLALRHRPGIGQGDAKLLAAAGAWLGWQALAWVVLAAAALGILAALVLSLLRRRPLAATTRVPFGACLAPVIFAAYLWLERLSV